MVGALAAVLVAAVGISLWYRATYWVWPGQAASNRLHWCGRDYERGDGAAQTWAQLTVSVKTAVRPVGSYPPLGPQQELLAPAVQHHPSSGSGFCPTVVYLRIGPGRYRAYSLLGGP